jgi:hypothetical protein
MIPAPKIKVVTRYVKSENWENGFPVVCMKFGNDKYSSNFKIEETFKEELIFEGPCPEKLRVLNRIKQKYMYHYMNFSSQIIPIGLDLKVAEAVRGTCYNKFFDHECYDVEGRIIDHIPMEQYPPYVYEYLTMFLHHNDWDRIEKYNKEFFSSNNTKESN